MFKKTDFNAFFQETHGRTATADDLTELLNRIYNPLPGTTTTALVKVEHTDLDVLVEGILDDKEMNEEQVKATIVGLHLKNETPPQEVMIPKPSPWKKLVPYAAAFLGFAGGATIMGAISNVATNTPSNRSISYLETIVDIPTSEDTLKIRDAYISDYVNSFFENKSGILTSFSHLLLYKEFRSIYHEDSGIAGIRLTTGSKDYLAINISNRKGIIASFVYDCGIAIIEEELIKNAKPSLALIAEGESLTEVNFDVGMLNVNHYDSLGTLAISTNGKDHTLPMGSFRTDYTGTSGLDGYKEQAEKVLEEFKKLY